ncbi:MFS transporter [Brevundimonas sp. R86498]|uniref:MFS transporter n=1 Tax=Brevundimonas sp. R86498 TaxID=3093845 RepID=UPI0037C772AB
MATLPAVPSPGMAGPLVPGEDAPAAGPGFIAAYTLAQIGAFVGFVPLLMVLLPLKAAALAPEAATLLVSRAAMWGAVSAGIAHLVAGSLSDRTQLRHGTRKPWIVAGIMLTALSYVGVFLARSPTELIAAIVVFQICFNILFCPLVAVFADHVPDRQKGLVSAFSGLAYPAASLFAGLVIAMALTGAAGRSIVTVVAMIALLTPFVITKLRRVTVVTHPVSAKGPGRILAALVDHDFRCAFASRLLVQTAMSLNVLYLLFYLQSHSDVASRLPGLRIDAVLGLLIATSTTAALVSGFAAGLASDRWGGRKGFVTAGALLIAAGGATLAVLPAWPGPLVGQMVYGIGVGIFSTADQALIAQVLPVRARIGRDLGVMNLAVTLPQVMAPLAGIVLLGSAGWSLPGIFALAAALAVGGGVLVQGIRRTL